ncbi:Uncharacterised protein [Vibrio metschnikovii]|nr:Uncharacterised protein [Vibrio metschnikovii]SUQ10650.1 Uncharacterised protein [Vibrio metschnikovii]
MEKLGSGQCYVFHYATQRFINEQPSTALPQPINNKVFKLSSVRNHQSLPEHFLGVKESFYLCVQLTLPVIPV